MGETECDGDMDTDGEGDIETDDNGDEVGDAVGDGDAIGREHIKPRNWGVKSHCPTVQPKLEKGVHSRKVSSRFPRQIFGHPVKTEIGEGDGDGGKTSLN